MPAPDPPANYRATVVAETGKSEPSLGRLVAALVTFSRQGAGELIAVREGRQYIGTHAKAQLRVSDPKVSEKHAVIMAQGRQVWLDDCLSTNGTFLNGRRLEERTLLRHGDRIKTGDAEWLFHGLQLNPGKR